MQAGSRCHIEWVQDLQNYFWTETQINRRLRQVLIKAFREVHAEAKRAQVDMRTAALMLGVNELLRANACAGCFRKDRTEV